MRTHVDVELPNRRRRGVTVASMTTFQGETVTSFESVNTIEEPTKRFKFHLNTGNTRDETSRLPVTSISDGLAELLRGILVPTHDTET
jgi:hypothetical protein